MQSSRLDRPLGLKTPNMGNPGLEQMILCNSLPCEATLATRHPHDLYHALTDHAPHASHQNGAPEGFYFCERLDVLSAGSTNPGQSPDVDAPCKRRFDMLMYNRCGYATLGIEAGHFDGAARRRNGYRAQAIQAQCLIPLTRNLSVQTWAVDHPRVLSEGPENSGPLDFSESHRQC